jgi:exonuclease III
VSLQEIKLSKEEANLSLNFQGYSAYIRTRESNPKRGGGVAILIRSEIPHTPILGLDDSLEIVGIRIETNEVRFDFISLYSPPSLVLPYELFSKLETDKTDFVMVGDLNAKSKSIGCKSQDLSGDVLDQILDETSIIVHNDRRPTYYQHQAVARENSVQYTEILDLVLSSSSFGNKIIKFEVLEGSRMESDHCPILFYINCAGKIKQNAFHGKPRLNFAKADWTLYKTLMADKSNSCSFEDLLALSIDELNELVCNHINEAVSKSVPKYLNRSSNSLPKYILDMISEKRKLRSKLRKEKDPILKTKFYQLANLVKTSIREYKDRKWNHLLEKFGPHPVTSSPFWSIINRAKNPKQTPTIPSLRKRDLEFKTESEKVELFASILKETFSDEGSDGEFDHNFKLEVSEAVDNHQLKTDFDYFSSDVIQAALEKLKVNSSPGADQIHNLLLKNLPIEYTRKFLYCLANRAIQFGIPKTWKEAKIIMIPKKDGMSSDPEKYRPISLTSCLGKLVERLVKTRLYSFIERKNLISSQQSGFREKRGAGDNLLFFTQKISEALNKGKKACGIFFDISKAFDKVWHKGLIYKLIRMDIPSYILKYIIDFLKDRTFKVSIGDTLSESGEILCSVPQGSVLGPILFLIYINDIPLADSKHISYSSLFADDLATLFTFKKPGRIGSTMKKYMENLVSWLFKWRLKINATKCSYIVFAGDGSRNKTKFELLINGARIPYDPNPVFLGIVFDEFLNFRAHVEKLVTKARPRLNIIKIFSHKSWKLSHETLKGIYEALIGSLFVYSFFAVARIADTNLERLQKIQNRALRCIYRTEWTCPTDLIHSMSDIPLVRDKLIKIGKKYLSKAKMDNSNVRLLLAEYLDSISSIRRDDKDTPLCLFHDRELNPKI